MTNLIFQGIINPTKNLRRSFASHLREFVQEGWLEKVWAPHLTKKGQKVPCIHLISPNEQEKDKDAVVEGASNLLEHDGSDSRGMLQAPKCVRI